MLAAGLATLASGIVSMGPFLSYGAEIMVLRGLAAERGLIYGTAIGAASIERDREFVHLVRRQAGGVVSGMT